MHNIEYRVYQENINRDFVQRELDSYVKGETRFEGGHGLGQAIRWLESVGVCADRDEAERVIEAHDRKWYDQLAVRFNQPDRSEKSKALAALEEKVRQAYKDYTDKDRVVWAATLRAEYVGCRGCGSKLCRPYIKSNRCPVCGADLRPETTRKAIESARARWKKAEKAVSDYERTRCKQKVLWLVKIEYHT